MRRTLRYYKWALAACVALLGLYIVNPDKGAVASSIALDNFFMVLTILPPVLVLIGLLDVWVSRETMVRHMGRDSGMKGLLVAIVLGSIAAGPLFVAFPIAAILAKKGARYAYIIFFVGVWTTTKLPVLAFEYSFMGARFTITHIVLSLVLYLLGALVIERLADKNDTEKLADNA